MKNTFFISLFLLAAVLPAWGTTPEGKTVQGKKSEFKLTPEQKKEIDDFNSNFMNYYKTKKTENIPSFLKLISKIPPEKSIRIFSSAITFFGEVYRANPKKLNAWISIGSNQRHMRFLQINALLYADSKEARLALKKYRQEHQEELKNLKIPQGNIVTDISRLQPTVPTMLDACWGGFFATGDKKYTDSIMKTAVRTDAKGLLRMTVLAARYSCASNAARDPQIKKLLDQFLAKCTEKQREAFWKELPEAAKAKLCGKATVPQAKEK